MSSNFKTVTTTVTVKETDKRLLILCTPKGFHEFKEYIGELMPTCIDDITFTDDEDYIISLKDENFASLLREVIIDAEDDTRNNIPKLFQDVFEKPEYTYLAERKGYFGLANEKNLIGKCNNEEYEILNNEKDFWNMSEASVLYHKTLKLKIITDRLTTQYMSEQFNGFRFSWKMRENEFVKPKDIYLLGFDGDKTLEWQNSCKQAWKAWKKIGGGERLSRLILPNTIAYEIHLNCEFMSIFRFCNTIVKSDCNELLNEELLTIFREFRDILVELNYLKMVNDLIDDMDKAISQYNLPF